MRQIFALSLLLLPLLLTACESGGVRETLGINRDAPDEFAVVSRPPLSLPPEFSLRPPAPGEVPRGQAPDDAARSILSGKPVASGNALLVEPSVETAVIPVQRNDALSGGANRLLKRAGADASSATIREQLGTDASTPLDTSKAKTLIDKLAADEKLEPVVDAKKEAERLRANKDAGKTPSEGTVPEIETKPRSLIDRVF